VPTQLERNGDFSKSFTSLNSSGQPVLLFIRDPQKTGNCTATDQTACFPGNVIPANRINKNGQALLNVYPLPNATNLGITNGAYNYLFQESIKVPKRQNLVRTDYRPRRKTRSTCALQCGMPTIRASPSRRARPTGDWPDCITLSPTTAYR
jgi:hypothetical protein